MEDVHTLTRWADLPRPQRLRMLRVISSKAKAIRKRKRKAVLAQQVHTPLPSHACTRAHMYMRVYIHARACTCTRAHMYTCIYTCIVSLPLPFLPPSLLPPSPPPSLPSFTYHVYIYLFSCQLFPQTFPLFSPIFVYTMVSYFCPLSKKVTTLERHDRNRRLYLTKTLASLLDYRCWMKCTAHRASEIPAFRAKHATIKTLAEQKRFVSDQMRLRQICYGVPKHSKKNPDVPLLSCGRSQSGVDTYLTDVCLYITKEAPLQLAMRTAGSNLHEGNRPLDKVAQVYIYIYIYVSPPPPPSSDSPFLLLLPSPPPSFSSSCFLLFLLPFFFLFLSFLLPHLLLLHLHVCACVRIYIYIYIYI